MFGKLFFKICGIAIICAFLVYVFYDCVNFVTYSWAEYDEAYNASVASNFARYGEYRISYPDESIFPNVITTGILVLIPTSLLYSLVGINNITSNIIPMLYGMISILLIWYFIRIVLKDYVRHYDIMSSILCCLVILSEKMYRQICTHLIGESCSLFFFILALISYVLAEKKNKNNFLLGAGICIAYCFLTKSSSIFLAVSFSVHLITDTFLVKRFTIWDVIKYIEGLVIGFVTIESFKIYSLGSIKKFLLWWRNELFDNMPNQSGGWITPTFQERFCFLEDFFQGNKFFFCALILFAIGLYCYKLYLSLIKNKNISVTFNAICLCGICGASIFLYFLTFGKSGLFYPRRLILYIIAIRIFGTLIFCQICNSLHTRIVKRNNASTYQSLFVSFCCAIVFFICLYPPTVVAHTAVEYTFKENKEKQGLHCMKLFLNEISKLPQNSDIYVAGWWQEPNITIFHDRKMKNIYDAMQSKKKLSSNSYFIAGNRVEGITISEIEDSLNSKLKLTYVADSTFLSPYPGCVKCGIRPFSIFKISKKNLSE